VSHNSDGYAVATETGIQRFVSSEDHCQRTLGEVSEEPPDFIRDLDKRFGLSQTGDTDANGHVRRPPLQLVQSIKADRLWQAAESRLGGSR
ncbi:uncharacterized protein METZ01_LOCUS301149, partial [marine metagenome]